MNDIQSVNDLDMLGTLLFPFERAAVRSDTIVQLVNQVIAKACQLISKKTSGDRNSVRGSLIVAYCAISLDNMMIHDSRVWQLIDYVVAHASHKYMIERDFRLLFRIKKIAEAEGLSRCPAFPEWIEKSEHFSWHEHAHQQHVRHALSKLADGALSTEKSSLVDIVRADGTNVLVGNPDETMLTWKDPLNDKNYELRPLETSGSLELLKRVLLKQGVSKIEVFPSH
jgi:hypothetical protein